MGEDAEMSDVVVTVPKWFWPEWIAEGDAVGERWSGEEWAFYLSGNRPDIQPTERVYIVAHGKLRGYALLTRIEEIDYKKLALIRRGGAVACTIPEAIKGFRGFRYRWWDHSIETPFPEWRIP